MSPKKVLPKGRRYTQQQKDPEMPKAVPYGVYDIRAHGLGGDTIINTLTVAVADELGETTTLYPRADALRAVSEPMPIKPAVDALIADLLVSAGRHPAAARHLAESSGQTAAVINLMEERLRRSEPGRTSVTDLRSNRGLALIDEWSTPDVMTPGREIEVPSAPEPPGPPAA